MICDLIDVEVMFEVITAAVLNGEITAVETVDCSPRVLELELITVIEVLEFFSL